MPQQLTPSQENYLEHIWHLAAVDRVRSVDLAESVGVKLPSVTRAVNKLASQGLVKHKQYGAIELTRKGRSAARRIVQRDKCITEFLVRVLKMAPERAKTEACRLEHVFSNEVIIRLQALVDFIDAEAVENRKLQRKINTAVKNHLEEESVIVGRSKPHA